MIRKKHSSAPKECYGKRRIHLPEAGNALIQQGLSKSQPFLTARIGSTELAVLYNYFAYRHKKRIQWSSQVQNNIWELSGVFPTDHDSLVTFSNIYLDAIKQVDVLGVWFNEGEEMIAKRF